VISIIDDDASVREATKGLIRSLGYDATTYRSADDFLESGGPEGTSCIITDIQMPGTNGLDLQDRLHSEGHATPVIFVTAFPEEPARSRAMKAGAYGFLAKPFDEAHLIACLDQAFAENPDKHRPAR
jgi:FixJ family two-component response regulator